MNKPLSKLQLVFSQSHVKKIPVAKQLLIADASIEDADVLIAAFKYGIDSWILKKESNVQEMLQEAICNTELSTLHLLGHGMPGEIILGNVKINTDNWPAILCRNPELTELQLKKISLRREPSSFPGKWNICFWSCRTGQGNKGRAFIQHVANCTGANVYASSGLIGSSISEERWRLDVVAYPINDMNCNKELSIKLDG